MIRHFNLISEPWIPCLNKNGEVVYLGIRDALVRSREHLEIRDDSPLVTISLYRLLLAVLHRVFGPESPEEWAELWSDGNGSFSAVKIDAYFKNDRVRQGFDLFDEKHPFYQCASLPLGPVDKKTGLGKYVKTITQMAYEITYSDNMNLFCHKRNSVGFNVSPAEAARYLVAFQNFAFGGRITFLAEENGNTEGSADAGQLIKSAVSVVRGDSVFQTLLLNLVHYNGRDEKPFAFEIAKDIPAWEDDAETKPVDRLYKGYLDLLTWQSRRVKLVLDENSSSGEIRVSGVVTMKGYQLPDDYTRMDRETMVGFSKVEKAQSGDGWLPIGFRESKSLWRDSHSLFQSQSNLKQRPGVLSWISELVSLGLKDQNTLSLDIFGVCADQAKILLWRHESFPLPVKYLTDYTLTVHLQKALELAEQVQSEALRAGTRKVAESRLKATEKSNPDPKRIASIVKSLAPERHYWSRLELPFREFMVRLAEVAEESRKNFVDEWYWETVRKVVIQAFERCVEVIDTGRDLKAINAGRGVLYSRLKQIQSDNQISAREKQKAGAS